MTVVVPFDGSKLSAAALDRARDFANPPGTDLMAISVIPNGNVAYARDRGWLDETEGFDAETVLSRLSDQVDSIAPEAEFEYEVVGRFAQAGEIASEIRTYARDVDADLVVIGSDDAGRIVSSVSSVGSAVATDDAYDVLIVRHAGEIAPRGERA